MASAGEIKNAARTGKQVAKAATNLKAGLSFLKALRDGSNSKISNGASGIMIGTALFLDIISLLSLIPLVGWIIGPVVYFTSWAIFGMWFKIKGASFFSGRAMASKAVTLILEIIPELSAVIPGITVNAIAAIAMVRIEEAAAKAESGLQENAKNQEGDIKSPKRPGSNVNLKNEKRPARTRPA